MGLVKQIKRAPSIFGQNLIFLAQLCQESLFSKILSDFVQIWYVATLSHVLSSKNASKWHQEH